MNPSLYSRQRAWLVVGLAMLGALSIAVMPSLAHAQAQVGEKYLKLLGGKR
jgi:hypothetical protein